MKITGKAILAEWNRRRSVFDSHGTELIAVHSYCAPVRMLINVFSIGDTAKCHLSPILQRCHSWSTEKQCPGLDYSSAEYNCCSYGSKPKHTANPIMALLCLKPKGRKGPKRPGNHIMELFEFCPEALDAPVPSWHVPAACVQGPNSWQGHWSYWCFVKQEWSSAGWNASLKQILFSKSS